MTNRKKVIAMLLLTMATSAAQAAQPESTGRHNFSWCERSSPGRGSLMALVFDGYYLPCWN